VVCYLGTAFCKTEPDCTSGAKNRSGTPRGQGRAVAAGDPEV
jgi:hypothetical protein